MRFITTILIPYIFMLGIMPCSDEIVNDGSTDEVIEMISSGHHDHNHSDQTDSCTSFCMCQCCSTPITFATYTIDFTLNEFNNLSQFYYIKSQALGHRDDIFQPPRYR